MGNAHGHHGDHGHRKPSGLGGGGGGGDGLVFGDRQHGLVGREMSPFDPIGPVDITKHKTGGDFSPGRTGPPRAHRPRATTESGPRRHKTIDCPDQDAINRNSSKPLESQISVDPSDCKIKKMPTIIKYAGQGVDVFLCGTFNGWQKMRMSRSQKDFVAMVELGEGDHEYKFFVDGNWATDQNAPIIVNEAGFKNNKIHVQKEDFNAFDALDMDSATVAKAQSLRAKANASQPQSSFGQIMPHSVGIPMSGDHQQSRSGTGPPILPPHLLQVILNKDTPMSCEPTLLPEPNHVMLNHLYALSIKDGVMVLSTTQRFKRKYVTTLLYKPMGTRVPDTDTA
jgi:5'-AMP-activated protein kinase regulatory beta subunit